MAGKFLSLVSGVITEVQALVTSAGAGDAGKIVSLDAGGHIDTTVLPPGVGPDTLTITTSEALSAGNFVNVWTSTGTKVRKADATVAGKEAHGFVLSSASSGASATVYFSGSNTAVTGLTVGPQYLQTTAGSSGTTAPTGSGNVVQLVGVANSATSVDFNRGTPITLA